MKAKCPIGSVSLQEAAKELASRGVLTGGHLIFKQLRELGFMKGTQASMKALRMGWLRESRGCWEYGEYCRVFLTRSGLDEVEFRLKSAGKVKPKVHDFDLGIKSFEFGF